LALGGGYQATQSGGFIVPVGGVTVGDNVYIGANAVVVQAGKHVEGVPAKELPAA